MQLQDQSPKSTLKQILGKYLLPITITSSVLISGTIGFTASQIVVSNSVGDQLELSTMQKQINEARNNSLKVIETEIPKIISDLDKYNQDINLLVENVEWLNENLAPIRAAKGKFDSAITVVRGVTTFVDLPIVSNISYKLASAQIQLDEIDSILLGLDNLTDIKQEISNSHQKLNLLFEEYQKEKSIQQLIQIEQELNSNLIYQIEDLRNTTVQAQKAFVLSSSVLITVNKTRTLFNSIQEMGKNTVNAIQFWEEDEGTSEIGTNIKESLEKDLDASVERIQKLPNEIAQRSKNSITSISNVQKEIQTIKIAQMITTSE